MADHKYSRNPDIEAAMIEIGRRLWERGYIAGTDGNFSARLDDEIERLLNLARSPQR